MWVFLTPSKAPPTKKINGFLELHKIDSGYCAVQLDQGRELWISQDAQDIIDTHKYIMEPTGYDLPNQNGKVERLNGTLGVMVRALLYSSSLKPEFWSAALLHAIYLRKNRLVHWRIGKTPYKVWYGCKPDIGHLRIFGSIV